MLNKCATWLTDTLYRNCSPEQKKRPVFIYGFEITISTLFASSFIVIISTILGKPFSSLLFLALFFFLRLFSGGYHAPTYFRCFLLSNAIYLAVFASSWLIATSGTSIITACTAILSGALIYALSPIRNANHPLTEASYNKNKRIAQGLVALETVLIVTLALVGVDIFYVSILSTSMAAVAALMILAKAKERLS